MKKLLRFPGWSLLLIALVISVQTRAQVAEGYYGPTTNVGKANHGAGTGINAFSINLGSSYDGFTQGIGTDNFLGPNALPGAQEIGGIVAPNFDSVLFNNGKANPMYISNTAGIAVNGAVAFNNGITTTLRSTRAIGLLGAIQFLGNAIYTPTLVPVAGSDSTFTDGFVSKVNPVAFVYPVGNVTDLRPITVTGTGTYTAGWSNSNVNNSVYIGALAPGIIQLATNGFWEWQGTTAATAVTASIPSETSLTTGINLWLVGYNGTSWVNLSAAFTTNTENSTNTTPVAIPANITAITIAQAGVIVNAKVFLQGNMGTGATMRTDLQSYYSGNLLPITSPFSNAISTYTNIGNLSGVGGTVVDWVQIEVRLLSNNYATAVETRSLLLKPNGSIVDVTGQVPTFNTQTGTARLVIKSRNHMAIMSNDITSFSGTVNYDFTTALSQASVKAGEPAQMKLVNGVYAMFNGDLNKDYVIDALDGSIFKTSFLANSINSYTLSDINMDGVVDAVDGSFFKASFGGAIYSTMVNY